MTLLRVLKYPHPFLTTIAKPVDAEAENWDEITELIDNMVETMYANRGIGLAAVQVGVDKRIIVLDIPEEVEPADDDFEGTPDNDDSCTTSAGYEGILESRKEGADQDLNDNPPEDPNEEFNDDAPRYQRSQGANLVAFVNPELIEKEGKTKFEEGCLSVPGITAEVQRFETVRISALDRDGNAVEVEAEGLFAIALQHEIDHLDGVLFIDRLSRLKREYIKRKLKKAFEAEQRAL
ncbi:MAG: peptide deformylase [Proteobacteria bacterium]|nr:peptide deformylase [Pseudomonadota bacterium]